jgi:hypothetical protein
MSDGEPCNGGLRDGNGGPGVCGRGHGGCDRKHAVRHDKVDTGEQNFTWSVKIPLYVDSILAEVEVVCSF